MKATPMVAAVLLRPVLLVVDLMFMQGECNKLA